MVVNLGYVFNVKSLEVFFDFWNKGTRKTPESVRKNIQQSMPEKLSFF
jgi:hypothetical protein